MKIALGADHAGYELKQALKTVIESLGHEVSDLGTDSSAPVDYPDYARKVADAVVGRRADRGVVVCGSGVGACVAANKVPGIRAGLSSDTFSARQGVEDDDVNVLCLGARVVGASLAADVLRAFLSAKFSGAERHKRRLGKVIAIEEEFSRRKP